MKNTKQIKSFFLLFATTSFMWLNSGCSKDSGPTVVSGKVVNAYGGESIPRAIVTLTGEQSGINLTGSYGSSITSVAAASDGSYNISFNAQGDYTYFVTAVAPECDVLMPGNPGIGLDNSSYVELTNATSNTKNIPLAAYGYAKIHFKNTAPYNYDDQLVFTSDLYSTAPGVDNDHVIIFTGTAVDTTIKIAFYGGIPFNSPYYVIKDSITTTHYTNINGLPFDTVTCSINY
ncbi:MAG TPA: hypothetical protein VNG53_07940 [Bacteroidia bacterium]|nr:hypothetical protein [Bacteroidia bacterium]